jgi:hypothetical protein
MNPAMCTSCGRIGGLLYTTRTGGREHLGACDRYGLAASDSEKLDGADAHLLSVAENLRLETALAVYWTNYPTTDHLLGLYAFHLNLVPDYPPGVDA